VESEFVKSFNIEKSPSLVILRP